MTILYQICVVIIFFLQRTNIFSNFLLKVTASTFVRVCPDQWPQYIANIAINAFLLSVSVNNRHNNNCTRSMRKTATKDACIFSPLHNLC